MALEIIKKTFQSKEEVVDFLISQALELVDKKFNFDAAGGYDYNAIEIILLEFKLLQSFQSDEVKSDEIESRLKDCLKVDCNDSLAYFSNLLKNRDSLRNFLITYGGYEKVLEKMVNRAFEHVSEGVFKLDFQKFSKLITLVISEIKNIAGVEDSLNEAREMLLEACVDVDKVFFEENRRQLAVLDKNITGKSLEDALFNMFPLYPEIEKKLILFIRKKREILEVFDQTSQNLIAGKVDFNKYLDLKNKILAQPTIADFIETLAVEQDQEDNQKIGELLWTIKKIITGDIRT